MAASPIDPIPVNTMISMTPVKLDSSTYLVWHRQILHMAECFDLVGFLDGSIAAPPSFLIGDDKVSTPNPAYHQWRMKDRKLLSVIWTSLSPDAMTEVVECTSACSAWKELKAAFSDASASRTHQLRDELLSLRRGSDSVDTYGRKFKILCDQLSAINHPVDEYDKIHWFLRGLGGQYMSFADTRLALTPMPSFRDLLHQAKQFESMLRTMDNDVPSPAAFLVDHTSSTPDRASHGGPKFSSGKGGQPHYNVNHRHHQTRWRDSSGSRSKSGNNSGRRPFTPRCQICRGTHFADKCPEFLSTRNSPPSANLAHAFKATCNVSTPGSDWYLDSGASAHMTSQPSSLDSPYSGNMSVIIGDGKSLPISHIGERKLFDDVSLLDVLVVPHITKNLLSISKLTSDYPVDILFSDTNFAIQNRATKKVLAQGRCSDGLYMLNRGIPALVAAVKNKALNASFSLWHLRLGHVPFDVISLLKKLGHLSVSSVLPNPSICSSCQLAKSKRLPFNLNEKRAANVLDLIHCDLWGPAPITTADGFKYYVVFIDDFSRFSWIYPLRAKSDFFDILVQFHTFVCNQFSRSIKVFQSDGGTEFVNSRVREFMSRFGILHRLSCPYTPQQNGRAERKHRHISETGLAMLFHSHAPASLWFDAFASAVFLINRLPSSVLQNKSPFEVLFGVAPNYALFRPFGCRVFPYLRDYTADKLSPRSRPCIFLGYNSIYKGFRCLDPVSSQIYTTRHAVFDEGLFPFDHGSTSSSSPNSDIIGFFDHVPSTPNSSSTVVSPSTLAQQLSLPSDDDVHDVPLPPAQIDTPDTTIPPSLDQIVEPDLNESTPLVQVAPLDTSTPPSPEQPVELDPEESTPVVQPPTHSMVTRAKAGVFKPRYPVSMTASALLSALANCSVPRGFKSASKSPIWFSAMQEEIDALSANNTWDLVPLPSGANVVGSKWVFRTKFHADGSVERHKARLVAQGFTQIPGSDFHHTFSPVVRAATVRVILAIAVHHDWSLHQLDVKNAFLNGVLDRPVFMAQPPGFVDPRFPHHVCRLKRALYGLRQAPLAWFQRFSSYLFRIGFRQSQADTSLFYFIRAHSTIFLLLYVDDIILTGNDQSLLHKFISRTHKEFAIKDLGSLNYFLGLEVSPSNGGLFVGQAKYARDILERAELLDSKPVATPLAAGEVLVRDGTPFRDPTLYRSLVGALQYLTITRPDLSYAVNLVSQFLQSPTDNHFLAVKRILRYVKGTVHLGLTFSRRQNLSITGYSDADWARCIDTRRSTYGYAIFLGGNLVSWSAKKQPTVARSSCESEYRAMANTAAELVWLSNLLREIHCLSSSCPRLLCDNKSAIFLSQNPIAHKRAKHIDLDYHFVRELVSSGSLSTAFVPSHLQLADIFTKSLHRPMFEFLRSKLCVCLHPTQRLKGGVRMK